MGCALFVAVWISTRPDADCRAFLKLVFVLNPSKMHPNWLLIIGLVLAPFSWSLTLRKCCPKNHIHEGTKCTASNLTEEFLNVELRRQQFVDNGTEISWEYSDHYCHEGYQPLMPGDEPHLEGNNLSDHTYGLLTTNFYCFELVSEANHSKDVDLIIVVCDVVPELQNWHWRIGELLPDSLTHTEKIKVI